MVLVVLVVVVVDVVLIDVVAVVVVVVAVAVVVVVVVVGWHVWVRGTPQPVELCLVLSWWWVVLVGLGWVDWGWLVEVCAARFGVSVLGVVSGGLCAVGLELVGWGWSVAVGAGRL